MQLPSTRFFVGPLVSGFVCRSDELLRTENLILMHDVIKYQVSVEEYFHNLLAVVNLGYFITSRFTSSFLCP